MITLIWLIRSVQGTLDKEDQNVWQQDWFIGFLVTILCFMLDYILVTFGVLLRVISTHV